MNVMVAPRKQAGFTMLEMVLASTLTTFLALVVAMAYQANQQSYHFQVAINQMNANARYISQTMIARLAAADVDVEGGASLALTELAGSDGGNAGLDTVRVRYLTDATAQLCDTASTQADVTANFSLDAGSSDTNSLYCTSDNTESDPPTDAGEELVTDIEHLRVLYGENTDDSDGLSSVDQWVSWGDVTDVNNVLAVQVGFMLRSENPITLDNSDRDYNLLDLSLTKNDGHLRQVYSFTVALTTRIPAQQSP